MKAAPVPKRKPMSDILWTVLAEMFQRVGLATDRRSIEAYMSRPNWRGKKKWKEGQAQDWLRWVEKYLRHERDEAPTDTARAIYERYAWEVER